MASKQDLEGNAFEENLSPGRPYCKAPGKYDPVDHTRQVDTEKCIKYKQSMTRGNETYKSNNQQGVISGRNIPLQESPLSLEKGHRTSSPVNQQVLTSDTSQVRSCHQDKQALGFQQSFMESEKINPYDRGDPVKVQTIYSCGSKKMESSGTYLKNQGEILETTAPTMRNKGKGNSYVYSKIVDSNYKNITQKESEVQDSSVGARYSPECNYEPKANVEVHTSFACERGTNLSNKAIPSNNATSKQNLRGLCIPHDNDKAEGKVVQHSNVATVAQMIIRDCKTVLAQNSDEGLSGKQVSRKQMIESTQHTLSTNVDKLDMPRQLNEVTRDARSIKSISPEVANSCKMSQLTNENNQKGTRSLKDYQDQISTTDGYSRSKTKEDGNFPPQAECKSWKTKSTGNEQKHQLVKQNWKDSQGKISRIHILQPVESITDPSGMQRKYYGSAKCKRKEKVIILLGMSGSGKTTLVDFVANYFQGVETADDALFQVNYGDEYANTTRVTAYTFFSSEEENPITIIDTPGLNHSSRVDIEDHFESIKTFLATARSKKFEIHAIGFVTSAQQFCLTPSERLVIEYVSTLFGQSVANHLITFVTFADNQETPPVIKAMKDYGVKGKIFVKFNNSIFSSSEFEETNEFNRVYWKIGRKSWKKCLKFLQELPPLSVNTLKTSQSKIYATTVSESVVKNLRAYIKSFMKYCKDSQHMTKEALQCCEHVWDSAAVVHHLRASKESGVSDVTRIVVASTEEVCKENAFNPEICVKLLSLASSRSLLASGIGIICGLGPLYECAKTYSKLQGKLDKNVPNIVNCSVCRADHRIVRTEPRQSEIYTTDFGSCSTLITYKCNSCECTGNSHKSKTFVPASQVTFNMSPDKLLQSASEVIAQTLQEHSLPRYLISKDQFLNHVNTALDFKYKEFIEDLLEV